MLKIVNNRLQLKDVNTDIVINFKIATDVLKVVSLGNKMKHF